MNKILKKSFGLSIEGKVLIILLALFVGVLFSGWGAAMKLRQTVAANAAMTNVDPGALIKVENLRNVADSQIANARAFFLMGSKSIFDKQKADKQLFADSLAGFEKQHSLPQVHDIVDKIEALEKQESEIFDQAMEFRSKQTESKIVGQFYQSKTVPILTQLNEHFNQIIKLHNADLDHARERARQAGIDAQAQIPKGMTWFTGALAILFFCLSLVIFRLLFVRLSILRERERLVEEAKKAILARDEVIAAVSRDLEEPLKSLNEVADVLKTPQGAVQVTDHAEFIKSTAAEMQSLIEDIYDQKKADMSNLTLRLDQASVADVLDDAYSMLQPLAKQRDITLQFDAVNQSVLAYFDRERVMRVLSNLVGNAIKFSRKHSRVVVKVKSDAQFVNISIVDNGPGIPEGQISGIFDNFWQASKTSDQGAGVGLAVVKTIIEAHGGTVKVDNLAQGTTFTFTLPRRRPANVQFKKPSSVRRVARPSVQVENVDTPSH